MSTAGRILIVDDDRDFVEAYRDLLGREGYVVDSVGTEAEAYARFSEPDWGVIILDQKLRGPGGPDSGLDLAAAAVRRAPEAKVIIATAYAEPASIKRAFALGVYDYLEKNSLFEHFLRVKVRNAMEVWRERHLAALGVEQREVEIAQTWKSAQTESDPNRKGELLERLMLLIFRAIPGFEHARVNRQNALEEIDVVVQNSSSNPFWQKEGAYLLVECKHWSKPVGVPELKLFRQKIEDRYGRSALGFFIAPGGYAETTKTEAWVRRSSGTLIVLLDRPELDQLVASRDRSGLLKMLHAKAVVAEGG
jgi:CheY-like chemotaxis protein